MMERSLRWLATLAAVICSHNLAFALDIVLTNDDGFESAYTHAVYRQLKTAGHRVMISAPAQNQSAKGTASSFGPIAPLIHDTRAGSIKAGSPGLGSLPDNADIHYVDSTPGCSVLYALDKLVPERWGKGADLVISGPNYGYNLGSAAMDSGTISAARYAIGRGVPAIAVSNGHKPTKFRGYQDLKEGNIDFEIADVVVRLVVQLETRAKQDRKPLLPPGVGLNVNIPAFASGEGGKLRFAMTRLGLQMGVYFSEDISQDPNVKAFGLEVSGGSRLLVRRHTQSAETTPAGGYRAGYRMGRLLEGRRHDLGDSGHASGEHSRGARREAAAQGASIAVSEMEPLSSVR